jgi:hypothetical protein
MTEELSKAFLLKLAEKWKDLSQSEKDKFQKKFDESKKELKKKIKHFLMVNFNYFKCLNKKIERNYMIFFI